MHPKLGQQTNPKDHERIKATDNEPSPTLAADRISSAQTPRRLAQIATEPPRRAASKDDATALAQQTTGEGRSSAEPTPEAIAPGIETHKGAEHHATCAVKRTEVHRHETNPANPGNRAVVPNKAAASINVKPRPAAADVARPHKEEIGRVNAAQRRSVAPNARRKAPQPHGRAQDSVRVDRLRRPAVPATEDPHQ